LQRPGRTGGSGPARNKSPHRGDDSIAITPNSRTAYVVGDNAVSPIDIVTNTVGALIPVGKNAVAIAITPCPPHHPRCTSPRRG